MLLWVEKDHKEEKKNYEPRGSFLQHVAVNITGGNKCIISSTISKVLNYIFFYKIWKRKEIKNGVLKYQFRNYADLDVVYFWRAKTDRIAQFGILVIKRNFYFKTLYFGYVSAKNISMFRSLFSVDS